MGRGGPGGSGRTLFLSAGSVKKLDGPGNRSFVLCITTFISVPGYSALAVGNKNLKQSLVSLLLKLSYFVSEPVYLAVKDNGVVAPKLSLEC